MINWIKDQLKFRIKYRAKYQKLEKRNREKYEAMAEHSRQAAKSAIDVLGRYDILCANLPYEHELSTKRNWEEYADARLLSEYQAQTRAMNKLRDVHREMTRQWQENFEKHGFAMYAQWRPITDAPKDGRTFLAYGAWPTFPSIPDICFCHWDEDDEWWSFEGEEMFVTHWMPLPEPPKE